MSMTRLFVRGVALLAATGASLVLAAAPDWVNGNAKKYPNEMYLVGRGVGSTADEAGNRARGDLAAVFEVKIEVVTANATEVVKSGSKEMVHKTASQSVSAKTDRVVSDVQIVEIWRDPATQDVHALAVLSRAKAAAGLREEIGKVDAQVKQELDAAKATNDALIRLGALQRAFDTIVNRDGFQASLKVVDLAGQGVDAPVTQAQLRAQMDQILKGIKIFPQVDEDADAKEFAGLLKGGVAAAGFLAQGIGKADLILIGKLDLNDLGVQQGWHWVRANVTVQLVEKESGRVRGEKSWPLKASAKDSAKTARIRVLKDIEKLFKEELRATIVEFASS
jgi:hypothetical protein